MNGGGDMLVLLVELYLRLRLEPLRPAMTGLVWSPLMG